MLIERPIQHGHVFKKGPSWHVQWREDVRLHDGSIKRLKFSKKICPIHVRGAKVTRREAEHFAWDLYLSKLNQVSVMPQTLSTVEEFWKSKFIPEWIDMLKPAGKSHYKWCSSHILPAMGRLTLRQVSPDHVAHLLRGMLQKKKSVQTALHIRNALSALFQHAKVCGYMHGDNPARGVRLPPMKRKKPVSLSFTQAHILIQKYPPPVRQMVYTALLTSLNVAEMAALREKNVNVTPMLAVRECEVLPPMSLAVRENFYKGEFTTPKTGRRRRIVPLTPALAGELAALIEVNKRRGADELIFQNRRGGVTDYHNLSSRILKPIAKENGIEGVSWHVFRRCTATWAEIVQMPLPERIALMGHAQATMTLHYTIPDIDRRRNFIEAMEERLLIPPKEQTELCLTTSSSVGTAGVPGTHVTDPTGKGREESRPDASIATHF